MDSLNALREELMMMARLWPRVSVAASIDFGRPTLEPCHFRKFITQLTNIAVDAACRAELRDLSRHSPHCITVFANHRRCDSPNTEHCQLNTVNCQLSTENCQRTTRPGGVALAGSMSGRSVIVCHWLCQRYAELQLSHRSCEAIQNQACQ